MLAQARAIAQGLLERKLSAERPIAILSGNDLEHAMLGLAAMMIGVPYAPISVPYSLMSADFGKLKSIMETLTPGVELVVTADPGERPATLFAELLAVKPTDAVDLAHAKVGPDTIGKFLFT